MTPEELARPLRDADDLDPLLERVGDARIVLLGEASHGTEEYYAWRTAVTHRLVDELGFSFLAVEGDWPACWEVSTWLRSADEDDPRSAGEVLGAFDRWPTWMWANREVEVLVAGLRERNLGRAPEERVGFYGFDVYSLWESMRATLEYLREHDPGAVDAALDAVSCFEPYGEDPQAYARATRLVPASCEDEVVDLLTELCAGRGGGRGTEDPELRFAAEQNAAVAREAERYYRTMVRGGAASWNVRDTHMADTLDRLLDHHGPASRAVVWAHNTHIGDARATDMGAAGLTNVGQLVRERHGRHDVVAVGFSGHRGSVIAGHAWGAAPERMAVPPARTGSIEDLLHREVGRDALLVLPSGARDSWLAEARDHRAIGVVYDPRRERWGNYVPTTLGERYDVLVHLEETRALGPLGAEARPPGEAETFPFGV